MLSESIASGRPRRVYLTAGHVGGMKRRHVTLLRLLVGLCAALLVGGVVTDLLATRIWPSLFVGIPAGLVAGAVTAVVVGRWLRRHASGDE